jgi:hypothetical protein
MALLTVEEMTGYLPGLTPEEVAQLIVDAEAIASVYAPCIKHPAFRHKDAARAIIRKAIVYDVESQNANRQSVTTGPYTVSNFAPTRSGTFYSPSQIEALRTLCPQASTAGMYSVQLEQPDTLARD